jgi:hypothetical protein
MSDIIPEEEDEVVPGEEDGTEIVTTPDPNEPNPNAPASSFITTAGNVITSGIGLGVDIGKPLLSNTAAVLGGIADGGWGAVVDQYSEMQVFDTYDVPSESVVTITCRNKLLDSANPDSYLRVQGILADAIPFSMDSKWDVSAIGALGAAEKVLKVADDLGQLAGGWSINQPFLNRRRWGGTSPLEMTIQVRFVARALQGQNGEIIPNARQDVYNNVVKLMLMLMPRLLGSISNSLEGIASAFSVPGPAPFDGAFVTLLESISSLDVPKGVSEGDPVSIMIGSPDRPIVHLERVYLTKINGTFSKALSDDGTPLSAHVNLTYASMDTPFFKTGEGVGGNNPFLKSSYANFNNVAQELGDLLNKFGVGLAKVGEGAKEFFKGGGPSDSNNAR